MSDDDRSFLLRFEDNPHVLHMLLAACAPGPAKDIIDQFVSVKPSDNPDARELLTHLETWLVTLEQSAVGESKKAILGAIELLNARIEKQEPGRPLNFDDVAVVFLAGLSCNPEVERQIAYVERRANTRKRDAEIRAEAIREWRSGQHKNRSAANQTVADRRGISLRTVTNTLKEITKK